MEPTPNAKATLFNELGGEVVSLDVSNQKQFKLEPSNYGMANGIYFLIVNAKDETFTERIVVSH